MSLRENVRTIEEAHRASVWKFHLHPYGFRELGAHKNVLSAIQSKLKHKMMYSVLAVKYKHRENMAYCVRFYPLLNQTRLM